MTHLPTEILLELRDREASAAEALHLGECPSCQRAIEAARTVREQLRALPLEAPPPGLWERIAEAPAPAVVPFRARRRLPAVLVSLAAAAGLTFLVTSRVPGTPTDDPTLVERSQDLEAALQALPVPGEVDLQTAETMAQVGDLLSVTDRTLAGTRDGEARRALWERRIQLLESLIRVRASQQALVSL